MSLTSSKYLFQWFPLSKMATEGLPCLPHLDYPPDDHSAPVNRAFLTALQTSTPLKALCSGQGLSVKNTLPSDLQAAGQISWLIHTS